MTKVTKRYQIIYADPPWEYNDKLKHHGGSASSHYKEMTDYEISRLPIENLADDNCVLFLWGTWPKLPIVLKVMESWGFEYRTKAFVWAKQYSNGRFVLGMGNWTRGNTEYCLLGVKGNKLKRISDNVSELEVTQETEHSEKPDIFRQRILELMGDLPRIELFARTRIHGWDVWGNDEKLQLQPLEAFSQ